MTEEKKIELLENIDSYIKGRLSQEEIEELWIEFLKYPEMFRYFETEVQIQDMIKKRDIPQSFAVDRVEEPKQESTSYKSWAFAAAAALIIAFGLQFFSIEQPTSFESRLALVQIELDEMVGMDVYRSDEERSQSSDLLINSAIAMAYNDSTEKAISSLRDLLKQDLNNRQLARAELNIGILLYNSAEYEQAKVYFERVVRHTSVRESLIEKGWWLYGNVLLKTGDIEEAGDALGTVYKMDGRFKKPATSILMELDEQLMNDSSAPQQTP